MKISLWSGALVRYAFRLACCSLVVGCASDTTGPTITPQTATLTVDASQAAAYVRLGTPATQVSVSDPSSSSAWDLAFQATTVTVNGGEAGPAGVLAYCICQNAQASNDAIRTMTPDNQLAAFENVTAASIPPDSAFRGDVLNPVISGWYSGTPGPAVTPQSSRSSIIRKGTSSPVLSKFRVIGITGATATNAGTIEFEYAIQPSPGAPFGPVRSAQADVRGGPVYFDLTAGAPGTSSAWDLRFSGYQIRLNGGVSGPGGLSAVPDFTTPFAQIDAAYAASAPPQAYRSDSYAGVFAASPWYRYNITGTDNQIWPTFNVYLVKRGNEVFRLQIVSYYSVTGAPRHITFRYARLR